MFARRSAGLGKCSCRWLGGQVRGGETSATVVKYGTFRRENELGVDEELPYARAYRVFNADQIEGLAADYYVRPDAPRDLGTEAEIGACFLGAQIGVAPEFGQSAAYVEGWLKALKEDKRAIFRAASEAQKAADFVLPAPARSEAAAA